MMLTETQFTNWVSALRSGEYKQGFTLYYNRNSDCYCAMGVLATTLGANPKEDYESIHTVLQESRFEKLWKVVELNDFEHLTFTQIADWLEQNKNVEFNLISHDQYQ